MIKCPERVNELLDCHGLVTEVLHVDFALGLIYEVDAGCEDAHPANAIDALDFLQNPRPSEFLVESRNAVLLGESFLHYAALTEQLR